VSLLGAGIAAILSILLRPAFVRLRCLCFSPPGCVFSRKASEQDYITSFILGDDIIPRLSLHSVAGLRNDVLEMLARIKVPKYRVQAKSLRLLVQATEADELAEDTSYLHRRQSMLDSDFRKQLKYYRRHQQKIADDSDFVDIQLYPPGRKRIVHLIADVPKTSFRGGEKSYTPVWAESADFEEIQVSRHFFNDHDPKRVLEALHRIDTSFTMD